MRWIKCIVAAIGAVAVFLVSSADAAEMWRQRAPDGGGQWWIYIQGEIVDGDHAEFARIAKGLPDGSVVVVAESPGGLIREGLNIGITIRARRFSTFVVGHCASACALMWLAGVPRTAPSTASIGFHGASLNGESSIRGNAVVGAYLAQLGYSYEVIAALISVGPEEMNWFSFEWARALGIRVIREDNCRNRRTGSAMSCATSSYNPATAMGRIPSPRVHEKEPEEPEIAVDTRTRTPEVYCPSGQVTEPCR